MTFPSAFAPAMKSGSAPGLEPQYTHMLRIEFQLPLVAAQLPTRKE
jgi:hypothetical protein